MVPSEILRPHNTCTLDATVVFWVCWTYCLCTCTEKWPFFLRTCWTCSLGRLCASTSFPIYPDGTTAKKNQKTHQQILCFLLSEIMSWKIRQFWRKPDLFIFYMA